MRILAAGGLETVRRQELVKVEHRLFHIDSGAPDHGALASRRLR